MILSHLCPFYMFFMFILVVILVFILPEKFNKKYLIYTLSGLNKSKALLQLREGYVVNEGEEDIDGGKLKEKEFIHLFYEVFHCFVPHSFFSLLNILCRCYIHSKRRKWKKSPGMRKRWRKRMILVTSPHSHPRVPVLVSSHAYL